ncbi:MAG: 4Fe-4S binding protein [Clostridia bacterium]|nr:4Fe-4S binding protein [Clostridia bacterium]
MSFSRNEDITRLSQQAGFRHIYFLYHSEEKTIVLLVFPYTPYKDDIHIPANYVANNSSYFSKKELINLLFENGIEATDVFVPIKPLAAKYGVGSICLNGLLCINGLGTRMAMHTLLIDSSICMPVIYDHSKELTCDKCGACIDACPFGAISLNGIDYKKCMRTYMNDATHSDAVKENLTTYMGCERCQAICHLNECVGFCDVPAHISDAFEISRLISGDTKEARRLVGKNFTGNGKLTAEAIVFAARGGLLTKELIALASDSPFDAVHDALRWAKEYASKE